MITNTEYNEQQRYVQNVRVTEYEWNISDILVYGKCGKTWGNPGDRSLWFVRLGDKQKYKCRKRE